ncbi:MAG: branched-chain amino acid ABC transporter permease [Candidatus Dormibacteria bacterium]|jgi:branched-chain amino acid transport system permease protein
MSASMVPPTLSAAGSSPTGPSVGRATTAGRIAAILMLVLVVVLALAPMWGSRSTLTSLIEFITLVALAQLWNLLAGYAGLVSIGQQAFVGLGSYSVILLAGNYGINPFLSVGLAGVIAAVVALPTAGLVFRLRAGYFAVGTWVVAEVFRLLVINAPPSLNLGSGSGTTLYALEDISRSDRISFVYWITLAAVAAVVLVIYLLLRSRTGLALSALRDTEVAARGLGVRVLRTKLLVYVGCAFGFGVMGALVCLNLLHVDPNSSFSIDYTTEMIFIVMIGGLGTIEGPILGAVIYYVLQQQLASLGTWYLIILGVIAIAIMVVVPEGLWGWVSQRLHLSLFPLRRRVGSAHQV